MGNIPRNLLMYNTWKIFEIGRSLITDKQNESCYDYIEPSSVSVGGTQSGPCLVHQMHSETGGGVGLYGE